MASKKVFVCLKEVVASAEVKEVNHLLSLERLSAECIATGALYSVENAHDQDMHQLAKELLCDVVVERYILGSLVLKPSNSEIFLDVWYKPGVTDVVGQSVQKAAQDLNIKSNHVATGKRYVFKKDKKLNSKILANFAAKTLFNPLVQECIVTV